VKPSATWPKIEDTRTNSRKSADNGRHDRYGGPLRQMRKIHAGQRHLWARMGCPTSSLLPFASACGHVYMAIYAECASESSDSVLSTSLHTGAGCSPPRAQSRFIKTWAMASCACGKGNPNCAPAGTDQPAKPSIWILADLRCRRYTYDIVST
jgi:hypothetical protein